VNFNPSCARKRACAEARRLPVNCSSTSLDTNRAVLSDAIGLLRHSTETGAPSRRRRESPWRGDWPASEFTGTSSNAGYQNREHGVVAEISVDALTIRRSDGSNLKLARDRVLSLDYSYAVTGHSAHGLDASRVILEKDTHSRTTDRRSFYTDLTRARDTAVVVTDSSARLAQLVHSDRTQLVALDVVRSSGLTRDR
jgi:hypothetical protein